jgi:hypothetical protein
MGVSYGARRRLHNATSARPRRTADLLRSAQAAAGRLAKRVARAAGGAALEARDVTTLFSFDSPRKPNITLPAFPFFRPQ